MKFRSGFGCTKEGNLGIARLRSIVGGHRQFDTKKAPSTLCAVDCDSSAMGLANRAHDRESQPSSTHLTRASFVSTIEALKNVREIISRNAQTTISHFENGMIVPPRYGDADISSFGGVLDCIVQEVHHYLLQPRRISLY